MKKDLKFAKCLNTPCCATCRLSNLGSHYTLCLPLWDVFPCYILFQIRPKAHHASSSGSLWHHCSKQLISKTKDSSQKHEKTKREPKRGRNVCAPALNKELSRCSNNFRTSVNLNSLSWVSFFTSSLSTSQIKWTKVKRCFAVWDFYVLFHQHSSKI